jgi:RNA ligase
MEASNQSLQAPVAEVIWPGPYGIGAGLPRLSQFDEMEKAGWVWSKRIKTADGLTYRLFNYSKGCAYERIWNDVTTVSRGLIICEQTGEVIAASMPKFYNLGETVIPGVVASVKEGDFEALVKMDGSCGIGYRLDGRYRWATRGSFFSEQAAVAQAMWDAKYAQHDALLCGDWAHLTLVTEIIHPETRVVCRYDFEDLVLIAARNRFTGEDLPYDVLAAIGERLGMRVVERIDGADVESLVRRAETLSDNEEGFIFRWADGYRLKVKGNEYKRLHRLLSGITPRELAFAWHDTTIGEMLVMMPEEFREETEALIRQLDADTVELAHQTEEAYSAAASGVDQKAFAAWVKTQNPRLTGFLFARRQQDQPQGVTSVCRAALADLFFAKHLIGMLRDMQPTFGGELSLAGELDAYLEAVGSYLWDRTRNQEDSGKVKGLGASLPKSVRGTFDGAVVNLQPQILIEKMRDFVRRSPDVPELAGLDVDAVFADAPPATSPEGLHNQWVFGQPMILRPFLDRWRHCGQRSTAVAGARKLLADAIRAGVAEEFLVGIGRAVELHAGEPAFNTAAIVQGLKTMESCLYIIFDTLPRGDAQKMADAAAGNPWAQALLIEAWAGQRTQVRDLYVASAPELKSFAKLEEA